VRYPAERAVFGLAAMVRRAWLQLPVGIPSEPRRATPSHDSPISGQHFPLVKLVVEAVELSGVPGGAISVLTNPGDMFVSVWIFE